MKWLRGFCYLLMVLGFIAYTIGLSGSASAAANQWTNSGPCGGYVSALAIDPRAPSMLYAGTGGGVYKITVSSIDGTITQGVNFKVVESTLPLTLSEATVVLYIFDRPEDLTISGGTGVYAAFSWDPTIVTASVSGSTLTVTPVKIGGPVNVVVTDGAGGQATVSVTVITEEPRLGCGVGITSEDVGAATPLTLRLNVTDNGVNPPAGVKKEWLVFGAIVNGVQTPFFFFTDAGQVVALSSTTDPAAVEYTFNHTSGCQTLTRDFVLGTFGLKPGDTFFYLYAWSPTVVTSFANAPDLKFDNVLLINLR